MASANGSRALSKAKTKKTADEYPPNNGRVGIREIVLSFPDGTMIKSEGLDLDPVEFAHIVALVSGGESKFG